MSEAWTVEALIDWTSRHFGKYGIPDPRLEAEVLLSSALGCPRLNLVLRRDEVVPEDRLKKFKSFIIERQKRKPVAYILGRREFMGLDFRVNEHTLIPRPETEILAEAAMRLMPRTGHTTVIDLCTGSGCIAVSLAALSNAERIYACDISREALRVAQENIDRHGQGRKVFVCHGDLFNAIEQDGLEGRVGMLVSNPPYIAAGEFGMLEPELAFEPHGALDGGVDGMDFYRRIAQGAERYLAPGGFLLFELSAARRAQIETVVTGHGFAVEEIIKDYAGLDRVLVARRRQE